MGIISALDDPDFPAEVFCTLGKNPVTPNSSALALATLWEYLRCNNFNGFGYYLFDVTTGQRIARQARYKRLNESQAFSVFDTVLEEVFSADLSQESEIKTNDGAGALLIYPVYGPHYQNAVFIVEMESLPNLSIGDLRWNLGAVLQQVHVTIAKSDSLARQAEYSLSPRETEVLTLMSRGQSNRSIAESLGLSVYTINAHVRNLMLKLGETDRVSACIRGLTVLSGSSGNNAQ